MTQFYYYMLYTTVLLILQITKQGICGIYNNIDLTQIDSNFQIAYQYDYSYSSSKSEIINIHNTYPGYSTLVVAIAKSNMDLGMVGAYDFVNNAMALQGSMSTASSLL